MPVAAIVSFVVVFALILLAVSVGLKFFDARRKKQVADMLQTAAGEPVVGHQQPAEGDRSGEAHRVQGPARARCSSPGTPRSRFSRRA